MKDPDDICNSDDEEVLPHLSMVAERHIMNRSVLTDSPRSLRDSACSNGGEIAPMTLSPVNVTACRKKMVTVSCQTIVTGEILATQLFHEDISV